MASNSLVSRRPAQGGDRAGVAERWIAMMGGVVLGVAGAHRGRWGGAVLAAGGAGLFLAGAAGLPVWSALLPSSLSASLPTLRRREAGPRRPGLTPERTQAVVTIAAPAEMIYRYWRNFANLPKLMPHLDRVEVLSAVESLWIAHKVSGGEPLRWRTVLDRVDENRLLTWHTAGDTALPHRASLMLAPAPGGRGTEVRLTLVHRHPPSEVARLLGTTPAWQGREALRRLKQRIETGELSTLDRQSHGDRGLREARE
jgi:uncharacterized membrane protein